MLEEELKEIQLEEVLEKDKTWYVILASAAKEVDEAGSATWLPGPWLWRRRRTSA